MAKGMTYKRGDDLCTLCRFHVADEVGSHMAPHFLIQSAYSFDGKSGRDREIVAREHVNEDWRPVFYGRSVSPEAINADMGHDMTEEDAEDNTNILVYDNLFCKACEKRFGILEQEYRKYYANPTVNISPRLSYLFWLSVFWRMSIGYMGILLGIEDELKIRNILDKHITTLKDIIDSNDGLGDFGYVILRTAGIMKGYSGIFGTRTQNAPYMIITNDIVAMLLSDVSKMQFPFEYGGITVTNDMVNTWDSERIIRKDITLVEFAKIKRFILDQPFLEGWGPMYENGLRYFREQDRHLGIAHSTQKESEALNVLESLDSGPETLLQQRYLQLMFLAELKVHAAKRLDIEYDILADKTMFIFPFDIENYRKDCQVLSKMGMRYSELPMVEYLFMTDKQKRNNRKALKEKWDKFEFQLDSLIEMGYTPQDILYDNLRSKGSNELYNS